MRFLRRKADRQLIALGLAILLSIIGMVRCATMDSVNFSLTYRTLRPGTNIEPGTNTGTTHGR